MVVQLLQNGSIGNHPVGVLIWTLTPDWTNRHGSLTEVQTLFRQRLIGRQCKSFTATVRLLMLQMAQVAHMASGYYLTQRPPYEWRPSLRTKTGNSVQLPLQRFKKAIWLARPWKRKPATVQLGTATVPPPRARLNRRHWLSGSPVQLVRRCFRKASYRWTMEIYHTWWLRVDCVVCIETAPSGVFLTVPAVITGTRYTQLYAVVVGVLGFH